MTILTTTTSSMLVALVLLTFAASSFAVTQSQINAFARDINDLKVKLVNAKARLNDLQQSLSSVDAQILDLRREVRSERTSNRRQYHEALRDFKRQTFEIDRIERDLALVESDKEIVLRDAARDRQRHEALNVIKQRLEDSDFRSRQRGYQRQVDILEASKGPLNEELKKARAKLEQLRTQLDVEKQTVDDATLDQDPRIASLIQKKATTQKSISDAKQTISSLQTKLEKDNLTFNALVAKYKNERGSNNANLSSNTSRAGNLNLSPSTSSKASGIDYKSYVFVISGEKEQNIERILKLRSLVETYNAKYIEANWNGFDVNKKSIGNQAFKEAFREYIHQIPKTAKLLLIGHGLGGGTAVEAATQIAYEENRQIELLAVFDPMGKANLRANIVYNTNGNCFKPTPDNIAANSEYLACIKASQRRLITPNVKYFYNRWQKDAMGPEDSLRRIIALNGNGKKVLVPTASGRFNTENTTESDQRRLFFNGDNNAHKLLLVRESKNLPNLLVEHLR